MADIRDLKDIDAWQALWDALAAPDAEARLVFKRSPTCSLSRAAEDAFERFVSAKPDGGPDRYCRVDVIAQRDVARKIAEDTGVRHESPQALLLGPGRRVVWHASHRAIHEASLAEAVKRAGW